MKLRIWLCVVILLLILTAPLFAQGDDSPPEPTLIEETVVTDEAEVEAPAVAPTEAEVNVEVPAEATVVVAPDIPLAEPVAPNETVDVQTWVDDVLEYLSNHTGEIILGVGLLLAILRIKQPMTAAEKARESAEIERLKEEVRLTPQLTDDFILTIRELILGMRRIEDALPAPIAAQRASPESVTVSDDKPTVNVFTDDVQTPEAAG